MKHPFSNAQSSALFLLLLGLGSIFIGYLQQHVHTEWLNFLDNAVTDFYANVGSELVSIAITVLIIDRANRKSAEKERKDELILQMLSPNRTLAKEAVRIMRLKGWLEDGTLSGLDLRQENLTDLNLTGAAFNECNLIAADLSNSKLDGTDLSGCMLQASRLTGTSLTNANMMSTNLYNANMSRSNLDEAHFDHSNLEKANLSHASMRNTVFSGTNMGNTILDSSALMSDLSGVDLTGASMRGVRLWEINLQNGGLILTDDLFCPEELKKEYRDYLFEVKFDQTTILPDGNNWTPETDISRFVIPVETTQE